MHWWFQQCPSCKVTLSVCLLPHWPVAMDSRYQLHDRLHQRSVILFLNELQWPRESEYHSRRRERAQSMKAYTVDTLWTTMIKKISRAAVQIAACWYGHPVRYSSCVWCKHITSSKFSSSKLSTTNHGSCPDCSWHHSQHFGPHSESQPFPCIPTLVRSRTSCALIVCWWSSTAFQSISRKREETEELRHLYKFPD